MMAPEPPVFPINLCIYDDEGRYSPIVVESEAQLRGVGVRILVDMAMKQKRKVIMEDPGGNCVFHAEGGKILFPTGS